MQQLLPSKKQAKKIIPVSRSDFAEQTLFLNGAPYSLSDYAHMRTIFNIDAQDIVLQFGRQTSKCCANNNLQKLANGTVKLIKDLQIGDELYSFDETTHKILKNKIKNVSPNGKQLIYKIITRTGRIAKVTGEHPFWTLNPKWTEAKDLEVGDLIGLSRNNSCSLPTKKSVADHEYIILAHLLMEGGLSSGGIRYTNTDIRNVNELSTAITTFDNTLEVCSIGENYPGQYRITNHTPKNSLVNFLRDLNLYECKSDTKFFPELLFKLTKEQTQDFLKICWNTDGYVSTASKKELPEIGIGLISENLIKGIQELLLRLQIHSRISTQTPKVYEHTNKHVYVLSIETAESVEKFYNLIKTYKLKPYKKTKSNNNRIVVSKKALQSYFYTLKSKHFGNLKNDLMRWSLKYDITYSKLKAFNSLLQDSYLQTILDADILYDRIEEIELLPEEETTSIEMEFPHNTFLIDDLITHNSTTLAALQLTYSCLIPNFKSLYVSPTVDQTKIYSVDRLAPFIESSPWIKKTYLSSSLTQNVFTKKLLNGSTLYLRYALLTPDRLRGISSDFNLWDETQDMIQDIIPVVDKSMSRSYYKKRIFAGTPKLSRGTLAHYWNRSTRNEWMVKCSGCSKYNYLDEANIGKQGLICRYCGHLMDPQRGSWVRTGPANADLEGFRVCALQFANAPWVDWQKDIVKEMENSSRAVFFNEVLGIAYDPGVAPVTEEEVRTCCSNQPMLDSPTEDMISRGPIYMGIDYGPANSEHSFTVVSILQPWQGKTHVLHMKRFTGKEADFHYIHNEVPRMFKHWRCQMIGADYGLGEASNSEIRSHIGDTRLIPFFHTTQKERLAYNDKIGAYTTSRVRVMTEFFTKIKKQKFVFPKWEHFETFADDILNVAIDYNLDNTKFKYVNSDADDALHSILYADLLTQLDAPRHITYSYQFEDPNNDYY